MKKTIITTPEDTGKRLDVLLAERLSENSRTFFKKLIEAGAVSVNTMKITEPKNKITGVGSIEIDFPESLPEQSPTGENIFLEIIYEDDSIYVINKQAGVAVHPGAGNERGTIVNALISMNANFAKAFDDVMRPGIVHRLDKDTTGCLVVAKTPDVQEKMINLFSSRHVDKKYLAITDGVPKRPEGVIETFFGRHPVNRKKMAVLKESSRKAITGYKVLRSGKIDGRSCAFLELSLHTGRTHQIRVHLAHMRVPVLGDKIYGGRRKLEGVSRQMLHASEIGFVHPSTGQKVVFKAPLPADFTNALAMAKITLDTR